MDPSSLKTSLSRSDSSLMTLPPRLEVLPVGRLEEGSLFHKEIWFFVGRSISPDIRGRAEALVTSRSLDAFLKKWSLLGGVIPILWMLEGTLAVAPNAGGYIGLRHSTETRFGYRASYLLDQNS